MIYKPLLIVLGEPYSTFSEIIFKYYKTKQNKNFKRPIVLIGSIKLLKKQMKSLNYKFKIKEINFRNILNEKIYNSSINIINVDFDFKKTFDKISSNSKKYINDCFKIALYLLKNKKAHSMINGPISKKFFLNKKYPGVTEYLSKKAKNNKKGIMLIYNSILSVSPITTHVPLKNVTKNISSRKIINNVVKINNFYLKKLKKKPFFAILGLNPHCETTSSFSEEEKIIIPAIKKLLKKKIKIQGPFSSDTFFMQKNINKFNIVIGMYHDQVLTPLKTLFKFDAINITIGIPFIRISPDHGTNNEMLGQNKSNPQSFISAINFIKKIK